MTSVVSLFGVICNHLDMRRSSCKQEGLPVKCWRLYQHLSQVTVGTKHLHWGMWTELGVCGLVVWLHWTKVVRGRCVMIRNQLALLVLVQLPSYCSARKCDHCALLLLVKDSHSNYAVRAFFTWHNNGKRLTTDFVFNDTAIFLLSPNRSKWGDRIWVAFWFPKHIHFLSHYG